MARPCAPSFLVSHRQNNNVVKEVGTPPVQSNLNTPQFALSTAVWDRVSKTQSPKDCCWNLLQKTALHLPLLISPGLSISIFCGNEGPIFQQQHPKLRHRAQELCESRGGLPWFPIRNCPYCLCGRKAKLKNRAQELCESRGGRPRLPVRNSPYGLTGRKATLEHSVRALEQCEGRGGRPGLPVSNSLHGLYAREATYVEFKLACTRTRELCEGRGGRPGLPVPNSPYGLCGRKQHRNEAKRPVSHKADQSLTSEGSTTVT